MPPPSWPPPPSARANKPQSGQTPKFKGPLKLDTLYNKVLGRGYVVHPKLGELVHIGKAEKEADPVLAAYVAQFLCTKLYTF